MAATNNPQEVLRKPEQTGNSDKRTQKDLEREKTTPNRNDEDAKRKQETGNPSKAGQDANKGNRK